MPPRVFLAHLCLAAAIAVTPSRLLAQDDDGGGGGGGGGGMRSGGGGGGEANSFITTFGPEIKERHAAVYPFDLALAGTEGEVKLKYSVDPQGVPRAVVVVEASDPVFAGAAVTMLEAWRFKPAQDRGRAVWARDETRTVKFNAKSRDVGFTDTTRKLLLELKKPEPAIVHARELDAPPQPASRLTAVYPEAALRAGAAQGEAMVECIIDPKGSTHLPRIVSATHPVFGWAAATAILRLDFKPPTRGGKAVFTRIIIPVQFKVPARPPAEAPPAGTPPPPQAE